MTGAIGEVFGGIEAIQLANAERAIRAHIDSLNERRGRVALRDRLFTEVLNAIRGNMTSLGMGIVLLVAAGSMARGRFTVGDFALFASYLWPLIELMRTLGALAAISVQTRVSCQRMSELAPDGAVDALVKHSPVYLSGSLPDIPQPLVTSADHLEQLDVVGLTYRHPSSGRGIVDVTFRLQRGTFTVIAGRIGAGKTTLLRALLGLLPADSGAILWNGSRVSDPATWMTPPRCAYTPQTPRLFSDTLRDNVLMGLYDHSLQRAIHLAVMEHDIATMEHGLDTVIGARGMRLSGGQIQRTAAARMFIRQPSLLVLDDVSSALDVETEQTLWERLDQGTGNRG